VALWVNKVGETASCSFPTEEIMGVQNVNFALKFVPSRGFSAQMDKKF